MENNDFTWLRSIRTLHSTLRLKRAKNAQTLPLRVFLFSITDNRRKIYRQHTAGTEINFATPCKDTPVQEDNPALCAILAAWCWFLLCSAWAGTAQTFVTGSDFLVQFCSQSWTFAAVASTVCTNSLSIEKPFWKSGKTFKAICTTQNLRFRQFAELYVHIFRKSGHQSSNCDKVWNEIPCRWTGIDTTVS